MKRLIVALLIFSVGLLPAFQRSKPKAPARSAAKQSSAKAAKSTPVATASVTSVFTGAVAIDRIIEDAIRHDQLPGAVVVVGHQGKIVYEKAYGFRALVPSRERMTVDTIFDVASLTKVIATTSSIMKLVESGQVRLSDKVTQYIPEYLGGQTDITVRQLLTHYSGLRPDVDLEPNWTGYDTGIRLAVIDKPTGLPGSRFVYSDINFILLGEIVRRTSGMSLPDFAKSQIFAPLEMSDTTYQPPLSWSPRIAPTEIVRGQSLPLRGVVHDPTTRFMGGIAGHAGLFSTAEDLSKFAEMMLGMGTRKDARIFSPLTVQAFTSPQSPTGQSALRGLGWDIDSPFSGPRGDLFPVGSYGHTGFTGTSLWIDPSTDSYVILMSNSVHPKLRPAITPIRSRVASAAAAGLHIQAGPASSFVKLQAAPSVSAAPAPAAPPTGLMLSGLDVLVERNFSELQGKAVGLITNHTGITRDGKRNIDVMLAAGINVKALYSPEHGITGVEDDENVGNTKDAKTGLPVWSLYRGTNRTPNDKMLEGIDVLVFDIQDVGARFYTYVCTMDNAMQTAARKKIHFLVLDRPNPITGSRVEGPMLDSNLHSFIGCVNVPLRHGMTIGELSRLINDTAEQKADLSVVSMKGWSREDWFDATGQTWIDPSPNMRGLNAALLYPGIGMLEGGKVYSVGRGTDAPFEQIGADWINGRELSNYLNNRNIPGVRCYPAVLKPISSNFKGKTIEGVRFVVTNRQTFDSVRFGLELGASIERLYPGKMDWDANDKLLGSKLILSALRNRDEPQRIQALFQEQLERFKADRRRFLLY